MKHARPVNGAARAAFLCCTIILGFCCASALAGGGPQNVAVVVNTDSWASLAVANEYVRLRGIPPANVVSLKLGDLTDFETVDVETFRTRVLVPVFKALDDRRLGGQIDCIAYSADVPYAVNAQSDVAAKPGFRGGAPIASVNGLTYLYQLVLAKDPRYLSLGINFYFRAAKRPGPATQPWTAEQRAELARAYQLLREAKWDQAEAGLRDLIKAKPGMATLHYNLACCLARQDRLDDAMAELRRAVDAGWNDAKHAEADKDLAPLAKREDFKKLLASTAKAEAPLLAVPPGLAFHHRQAWGQGGELMESGKGLRYFLSTMLAVTSGRGNSLAEAVECLRRAAGADGTAPKGTVYFMTNNDIRSRTRQWGFASAVAALKGLGVAAEIAEGSLPSKKPDVAGLMAGVAGFNWPASGSTILPGAICEHLTSFGGVMHQRAGQTPISDFIGCGAAGSSGTVTEPFAIQAKFPTPFVQVYYARGFSLAEAFYQSVAGPYQLLILGDPLCRPWAKIPQVRVDGIQAGAAVKGKLTLKPLAKTPPGVSVARYELFVDGARRASCAPAAAMDLDTAALADGWHELRIVAVTADATETQGCLVLPVEVANHGRKLAVSCRTPRVRWGEPVEIEASLPGATRIELTHDDRVLCSVAGAKAQARIDSRTLGLGTVRIFAAGVLEGDADKAGPVRGRPVEVTVQPPATLAALTVPKDAKFAPGLKLTPAGGKPVVVKDVFDASAVEKAGIKSGQAYTLQAHFDVPADDLYQFQIHASGPAELKVDSRVIPLPPGDGWKLVPVSLAKGTHRFILSAQPKARPRLDLRFGSRGAQSPTDKTFRHVADGS